MVTVQNQNENLILHGYHGYHIIKLNKTVNTKYKSSYHGYNNAPEQNHDISYLLFIPKAL